LTFWHESVPNGLNLVDLAERTVTADESLRERAREAFERAFAQLPAPAERSRPGDVLPLDHYDVPDSGYRLVDGYLEKWIPVYETIEAESPLEIARALGGSYAPSQRGWRIERRLVSESCHCTSGHFELKFGHLNHVDGCGRSVSPDTSESPEQFRSRMASLSIAPSDEYLNGLYPTLGGRDDKDPQSWITKGRSEYRERTKGMIHWGSSTKDEASWNGNTQAAIDSVKERVESDRATQLRDKVEAYSKKQFPRKLNEL
jgi:hypothetical protein